MAASRPSTKIDSAPARRTAAMWRRPGSSVRGVVATTPAPNAWTDPRTSAGASTAALVQLPTDANSEAVVLRSGS